MTSSWVQNRCDKLIDGGSMTKEKMPEGIGEASEIKPKTEEVRRSGPIYRKVQLIVSRNNFAKAILKAKFMELGLSMRSIDNFISLSKQGTGDGHAGHPTEINPVSARKNQL
jgi:hypothetical protein